MSSELSIVALELCLNSLKELRYVEICIIPAFAVEMNYSPGSSKYCSLKFTQRQLGRLSCATGFDQTDNPLQLNRKQYPKLPALYQYKTNFSFLPIINLYLFQIIIIDSWSLENSSSSSLGEFLGCSSFSCSHIPSLVLRQRQDRRENCLSVHHFNSISQIQLPTFPSSLRHNHHLPPSTSHLVLKNKKSTQLTIGQDATRPLRNREDSVRWQHSLWYFFSFFPPPPSPPHPSIQKLTRNQA